MKKLYKYAIINLVGKFKEDLFYVVYLANYGRNILIAEIITVGFLIFWLSIGSLFAMITSLFTDNLVIQTAVFVISSTILIFVTKPFVKKFATNKKSYQN